MLGAKSKGGARECGTGRVEDGLYLECGLATDGMPVEAFLIDPPLIPPDTLRAQMTPIGMTLWQDGMGTWHVIDWVGKGHYPYPADFIEEARLMGFSRRAPKSLDFSKLTPASRMIFVHERGRVANYADYAEAAAEGWECPCGKGHPAGVSCAELHWRVPPSTVEAGRGRVLKSGTYPLRPLAPSAPEPVYTLALIASVPLTSISLIGRAGGGYDKAAYDKAIKGGLPVDVVPE